MPAHAAEQEGHDLAAGAVGIGAEGGGGSTAKPPAVMPRDAYTFFDLGIAFIFRKWYYSKKGTFGRIHLLFVDGNGWV